MYVRRLTDKGSALFEEYLTRLALGAKEEPPLDLLTAPEISVPVEGEASAEPRKFATRLEAASYLRQVLESVPTSEIDHNPGLWNWLSLFYFNQLCPPSSGGTG